MLNNINNNYYAPKNPYEQYTIEVNFLVMTRYKIEKILKPILT